MRTLKLLLLLSGLFMDAKAQQWGLTAINDGSFTSASRLVKDETNNLYVGGHFTDSIFLGGQWYLGGSTIQSFIISFNSSGQLRWVKIFGGSDGAEFLEDLAYRNGVVYAAGYFTSSSINFQVSTINNLSPGVNECYLTALDTAGNYLWAKGFGSSGSSEARINDIDVSDNAVYAAGSFQGAFDAGNFVVAGSSGGFDAFFLKTDLSGQSLWIKGGNGTGGDFGTAIAADDFGNVFCAGSFGNLSGLGNASLFIGTSQLTAVGGFGFTDLFIARYDTSGIFDYAIREGGGNQEIATHLAVKGGKIYFGGSYYFETVLNSTSYFTNGSWEGFIYELDTALSPQWTQIITTLPSTGSGYFDDFVSDMADAGISGMYVLSNQPNFGYKLSLIGPQGTTLYTEALRTNYSATIGIGFGGIVSDGLCGRITIAGTFSDSLISATDTVIGQLSDFFLALRTDSASILYSPQNINGTAPDTICADYPLFSISTDPVAGALSYGWQIIPQQAGTINGTTNFATVNIDDNYSGPVAIVCFASSACASGPPSDTLNYWVNAVPLVPTLNQNGVVLTASGVASSYIWYYNGNVIPNQNSSMLTATANGTYQVAAVQNGCESGLSSFVIVNTVSLPELAVEDRLLYPNPANDYCVIKGNIPNGTRMRILDLQGRLIKVEMLMNNTIYIADLKEGIYLTEIINTGLYCKEMLFIQR